MTYSVYFLESTGKLIHRTEVSAGESAVAPDWTPQEGRLFSGWSREFTSVTQDLYCVALTESLEEVQAAQAQPEQIQDDLVPETESQEPQPSASEELFGEGHTSPEPHSAVLAPESPSLARAIELHSAIPTESQSAARASGSNSSALSSQIAALDHLVQEHLQAPPGAKKSSRTKENPPTESQMTSAFTPSVGKLQVYRVIVLDTRTPERTAAVSLGRFPEDSVLSLEDLQGLDLENLRALPPFRIQISCHTLLAVTSLGVCGFDLNMQPLRFVERHSSYYESQIITPEDVRSLPEEEDLSSKELHLPVAS